MRRALAVFVCTAALLAACSGDDDAASNGTAGASTTGRAAASTTTAMPAGAPPEVAAAANDWPLPDHDYGNSRATTTSRINSSNVDDLKVAWRATPDGLGALSTSPLVLGDTVYVQGGTGMVVALDRADGRLRWKSRATGFNIGPFGVAVGDGRVYGVEGSRGVAAFDARTGKDVWTRELSAT